uniref:Ciliogenesis and planar polarity effector 1 isoform X2 n=1 Tax=Geotrypetes seraphini TaxID=260995 RepID=A0A6P8QPU1_GEOSA|nr:ciliogenesis and planar polarity effector 1 isoform X2 [Geotrypetes seraphini]
MEIKLEVLVSSSIKRKKPCPRFCWLGQEKESIFILDEKQLSELNLPSGRTKKKAPRLQTLLRNAIILATSRNGAWLAGILEIGEIFLWHKDRDYLKTVPATEEFKKAIATVQAYPERLHLYVSEDGRRVLVATLTGSIFLWESTDCKTMPPVRNPVTLGRWSQIMAAESIVLPTTEDKEAVVHAVFVENEILGDCCLCSFVFYSGEHLMLIFLKLKWHENSYNHLSSLPYQVKWAQQEYKLARLVPQCESVKTRGALFSAFARDGLILAVTINQKNPKFNQKQPLLDEATATQRIFFLVFVFPLSATQILFINTINFVTVNGSLKGCSSKCQMIPSKYIRSYWVGDMSWTLGSLFLACMLKRGTLILMTRLGELQRLVTFGCSVEFGPAEFIPLHPLITYRPYQSMFESSDSNCLGSSSSDMDAFRQRFSVVAHPRLPYLIVSDGYMITALRFLDNLSPALYMRSLLLDSHHRLENISRIFSVSKPKDRQLKLQPLPSLKNGLLKDHRNQNATHSTLPRFLQGAKEAGKQDEIEGFQDCEEESDYEQQFSKNLHPSFSLEPDSSCRQADQGKLEFASMFDTIHAIPDVEEKENDLSELNNIQQNLLMAWDVGILLRNTEEKNTLLNYTVQYFTHLIYILQFSRYCSKMQEKLFKKKPYNNPWVQLVFQLFHQCLWVLHWDVTYRQAIGHMVKLTSETLKMMLMQQEQLYSRTLLESFCLLKMVFHSLNIIYSLPFEIISASGVNGTVDLDFLMVPVLQALDESSIQRCSVHSLFKLPPQTLNLSHKPGNRLAVLWKLLHRQTVWYQAKLVHAKCKNDKTFTTLRISHEESMVLPLLCHIQAVLQSAGERLDSTLNLTSVIGEEHFLYGSYTMAVQIWKTVLQEDSAKGGKRAGFLQTRYYLAILYCHLYQYNLSNGQGLCDHLVREMLRRSSISIPKWTEDLLESEYIRYELEILRHIHSEAALAVIQSLGRFMAAYFTNQPLYVLPPHNIDVLPPFCTAPDMLLRVIPLQQSVVARVIRDQNLSCAWTVEYALELLLIGGLFPEAVLLAHKLGDWKMSVSMSLAYDLYCQSNGDLSRMKTELSLPIKLTPVKTFQEKLQSFLGRPDTSEMLSKATKYKQFSDPIEEEDVDVLFNSVQEMLKAAVMANADILSETFQLLIDSAKDHSRKLCGLVPERLYLPCPPLYCPQPTSVSEGGQDDVHLRAEKVYRQKVSGVLQRILLLLRAAHCSIPVAQWYIKQLKWARKVMQKIRAKSFHPLLKQLPESLLNYSKRNAVFFRPGPGGDHQLDEVSCRIISDFRELCALCWMHHVRERLTDSCRHFQIARDNVENQKDCKRAVDHNASIVEHCLNALEWACRMLPFSRFMNIEELVQDIILSLIGELPPIKKVAEIWVKAFPNSEDVRVPLRDKYHSLQERLRHCIIKGPEREEMMSAVMHNVQKVKLKILKRVIRNIGGAEMNIWEPAEEETRDDETHCYDRFSLGTSLSKSTLTDYGKPQVYSDAETADTLSEALLTEETDPKYLQKNTKQLTELSERRQKELTLPVVGTWEFERDDDEYVLFLELFLSYILERDLSNSSDPGIPFLTSFTEHLQEYELNSVLFDVHASMRRWQIKTRSQSVFRAGCFYDVTQEPYRTEKPVSSNNEYRKSLINFTDSVLRHQLSENSVHKYFCGSSTKSMGAKGLFSLKQHLVTQALDKSSEKSIPFMYSSSNKGCPVPQICTLGSKYTYKLAHLKDVIPNEELSVELKTKFSRIAKLLEWMIRWSNKSLPGPNKAELLEEHSTMIRVKTSAAAILTSLWLFEQRHCTREKNFNFRVPNPEYIVAPVFHPETRPVIQKENNVDTVCPGSASTPDVPEADVDELCERLSEISSGLKTYDMNEPEPLLHSSADEITDCDSYPVEEREDTTPDAVDLPSAYEEDLKEQLEPPTGPSISVSIKPVQQLKNEDIQNVVVEHLHEASVDESLEEKNDAQENSPGSASSGKPLSLCIEMTAAACGLLNNVDSALTKLNGDHPSVAQQSNPGNISSNFTVHVKQEIQESEMTTQPLNMSEAVRQMFQDEMFRLLQLQQINFMSLMQVVGSSFASLPNMQQILQQHQSAHQEQSQTANPLRSNHTAQSLPAYSKEVLPCSSLKSKQQPSVNKTDNRRANYETSSDRQQANDQHNQENIEVAPDLSHPLYPPELQATDPLVSQNLFSTDSTKSFHLLMPVTRIQNPTLIPASKRMAAADGFPLLKLQPGHQLKPLTISPVKVTQAFTWPPPRPREAWGPSNSEKKVFLSFAPANKTNPPTHLNLNQYDTNVIQQTEEKKKTWADIMNKGPPKHLNLDQYDDLPTPVTGQQNSEAVSAGKSIDFHGIPAHEPYQNNSTGLPLLHLQIDRLRLFTPIVRPHVAPPLLPIQPVQQTNLPLLQAIMSPEKKMMSKLPGSPCQPPKLIPLQNLIAFQQKCQNKSQATLGQSLSGQIHLLKANIEPFEIRTEKDNKKRQKRRAEKQKFQESTPGNTEKTSVTFRPKDSIINLNSLEKVVQTKPHKPGSPSSEPADEFVIPLGSFDSSLLEQISVRGAVPTPAELHYLASTRKKVAEKLDASTNTDSVPSLSTHATVNVTEIPVHRINSLESSKSYRDIGIGCEEIISKLDKNHQIPSPAFPVHVPSSAPQVLPPDLYLNLRFQTEKTLPSSAPDAVSPLVGHKYINVIDIDAEDLLKELPITTGSPEIEVMTKQHECLKVPSSAQLHHMAASVTNTVPPDKFRNAENLLQQPLFQMKELNVKSNKAENKASWDLKFGDHDSVQAREQATKTVSSKVVSKRRITSKLHEIDAELSALQSMAENMEQDFANTELLVNTIENLGSAVDPDLEVVPVSSREVGITEKDFIVKGRVNESFSGDKLNITGLSDVADIISDLVRDGGIGATELGLTEAEAKKISRINVQDKPYGPTSRADNEKKEIQAWMKKKQKERLAVHRKKLDELRGQEHHPFQSEKNVQQHPPTSKKIRQIQKMKEEKDKALLSDHFDHRVSEAVNLMKEILSETVQLPATNVKSPSTTPERSPNRFQKQPLTSAKSLYFRNRPEISRSFSASHVEKRSVFQKDYCEVQPRGTATWIVQKNILDPKARARNISSYPINRKQVSLPRDRLSQITHRGMLSNQNKRKLYLQTNMIQKSNLGTRKSVSASEVSEPERSSRSKLRRPMTQVSISQIEETGSDYEMEREIVSPWTLPEEISKILNSNSSGFMFKDDAGFSQGFKNNDNASESTGSLLSKLDWKAIEDMVANEEDS